MSEQKPSLIFPPRRDAVRGWWVPVYLEPTVHSGERICVGVVAFACGESLIKPAPGLDRLRHLYGSQAEFLTQISLESLEYVAKCVGVVGPKPFALLELPGLIEGVYVGESRESAGNTIEEIAECGQKMCVSLLWGESVKHGE